MATQENTIPATGSPLSNGGPRVFTLENEEIDDQDRDSLRYTTNRNYRIKYMDELPIEGVIRVEEYRRVMMGEDQGDDPDEHKANVRRAVRGMVKLVSHDPVPDEELDNLTDRAVNMLTVFFVSTWAILLPNGGTKTRRATQADNPQTQESP